MSDAAAYAYGIDEHNYMSALPVLCLLFFYYSRRTGEYKLKDYTYSLGLLFAAGADVAFEFENPNSKILSLILYMLSFSFYIATVRREAVFGTSSQDLLKVIANMALIISPILFIFPEIPSDYFFASLLYMVFLALFYVTALLRKTNKSSYRWFLAGALAFGTLTICEVYFTFLIKVPYGTYIIKLTYYFAQYAIFIGVIRTYRNFYPPTEK